MATWVAGTPSKALSGCLCRYRYRGEFSIFFKNHLGGHSHHRCGIDFIPSPLPGTEQERNGNSQRTCRDILHQIQGQSIDIPVFPRRRPDTLSDFFTHKIGGNPGFRGNHCRFSLHLEQRQNTQAIENKGKQELARPLLCLGHGLAPLGAWSAL